MTELRMIRQWAMPNKNTFSIKPIRELILRVMQTGFWLDPFANSNKFTSTETKAKIITNDLNPEFNTNYHLDALEFLQRYKDSTCDGVLFDPPFSKRQLSECYKSVGRAVSQEDTQESYWSNIKKEISRITKQGGKVVTFGWNSGGVGKRNGFELTEVLLVPHGGGHYDTIVTVEVKR